MGNDNEDPVVILENETALETPLLEAGGDEEDQLPEQQQQQQPIFQIVVVDEVTRGEKQPDKYRDLPFAILFLAHWCVVGYFAVAWGIPALISGNDASNSSNDSSHGGAEEHAPMTGLLILCLLCVLASLIILSGTVAFMIRHAHILIQFSLISSFTILFAMGVTAAFFDQIVISVIYLIMAALGVCYAYLVWRRIPFARANLVTATTSIQANLGVMLLAGGLVLVYAAFLSLWVVSFMGIYAHYNVCDADTGSCDIAPEGRIAGVFYMLSFYWTLEVTKNIMVVTIAGIVGTWWFAPHEAASFWSPAIKDSFSRATMESFGSICLGSLLMAVIQIMIEMVRTCRRNNNDSFLLCILECLLSCLQSIAEYFNRFAMTYIGLYGYEYLTAGKKVMELFTQRGWTTLINDSLVHRALTLVCLVVGALTGVVGLVIAHAVPSWVVAFGDDGKAVAFLFPFMFGIALSSLVLGVVSSAVDAVIVCFAESPNEFQANYPELSSHMREAWRQIYPEEFLY